MMNVIILHTLAGQAANKAVPEFKDFGTPEHDAWLAAYDAEMKLLIKEMEEIQ